MKKTLILPLLIAAILFLQIFLQINVALANGQNPPITTTREPGIVPPPNPDILNSIDEIIGWLIIIILILAVIAIIIAGFYFVTAAGDPEKVAKARNFILFALIGVAVALLARAMVSLVRYILQR